jgi:hypothetical protein
VHISAIDVSWSLFWSGASAVFTVVAIGIFVRSIVAKKSSPYLLAWGIRVLLVAVAFLSQLAAGATYSLALSGGQLVGGLFIIGLIINLRPDLGRLRGTDWLAIALAGIGVAVWKLSGNPLYGLLGSIIADGSATALGIYASIVRKTYDSVAFWCYAFLAAGLAILATGNTTNMVIILAPAFSCLNAAINIGAWWYVRQYQAAPLENAVSADLDAV